MRIDGERLPPRRERSKTSCDREPQVARRIVGFLLGDDTLAPSSSGLLRYLGWTAMARFLRPVVTAFDSWRDEERWLRRYCPTCGSLPAMAQLAGVDPARTPPALVRLLRHALAVQAHRMPFCETDSQRLTSVTIDGEPGLRVDQCESCRGYLKTYVGEGDETLLLSDWSSLHLDLIARDRGLKGWRRRLRIRARAAPSGSASAGVQGSVESAGSQ